MTTGLGALAADWDLRLVVLVERELLVFAAFWFVIGLIDEFAIDLAWLVLRFAGRAQTPRLLPGYGRERLGGRAAVLIPAIDEAAVIGTTIAHILTAWPQKDLRLYIGCYRNDAATLGAAMAAAGSDPRVRLVVHGVAGPTTKADCLNRLYRALCEDEARGGVRFKSVILHDAEDMVHPCALQAIDHALRTHDFVQLPVRPLVTQRAHWISGHYADEFAESHAKTLVVRSALGAGIPAAGVGCGFSRAALERLAIRREGADNAGGAPGPFAPECLTEDYELGLVVSQEGRGSLFLRVRDAEGHLVATSSYFPATLASAVRQKTRWVHGIAFQSWERLGWSARPLELWMALRDRRGPLTALVLAAAYLLLLVDGLLWAAQALGWRGMVPLSLALKVMIGLGFLGFVWRAAMRAAFTGREYGVIEALRSVLRIPLGNIIAIMAGRRALAAYLISLRSGHVVWDKTAHALHPAQALLSAKGARA